MKKAPIDNTDKKILNMLQHDATMPVAEIAAMVNLSPTPCWIITRRVAILDAQKLNLAVTVFVAVKTSQHSEAWFKKFHRVVMAIPEVLEFYRMSGDIDYLLRIVVPDIARYDKVYRRLIEGTELFDVSSSFAMEQLKLTTVLPLEYVD